MSEHSNGFWEQIRQLCEQKKTIHTLDRGVANTLSDADDGGLIATSSQTNRPRRIYRSSLEKLWEASKESLGAEIRGNWDAIEAAIVGHLPNIEYALRPMRLFFVDPPAHELGTSKLRGEAEPSVIPKEADEVGEVRHEKETKADKPGPVSDLDPNWGPFPKLGDSAASDTEVKILITDDDPIWLEVKSLVDEGYRSIVFAGPPGTSKTWYAHQTALKLVDGQRERILTIQFHPSYSYEDFVEGRVPTSMQADEPFPVRPKIFLNACMKAAMLEGLFVLVIDEISRGDPSRIFGEVLTYIEHRDKKFILPYSARVAFVPGNLVILGTMNPYDKSVADLDQALQRRFEYVPMAPDPGLLQRLLDEAGAPNDLAEAIQSFFMELQSKCPNRIGHAYFQGINSWDQMPALWRRKLHRVLEDHFYPETERVDEIKQRFDFHFVERHP
jgi:hypothetical protein